MVTAPPWLDVEAGLSASGFNSSPSGRSAFHDFVLSRAADPRDSWLSGDDLQQARRLVRQAVGAPVEVTDSMLTGRDLIPPRSMVARRDGVLRPRWPGGAMEVLLRVCVATGVPPDTARSRQRIHAVVSCRRVALWTWSRELGRQQAEMNAVIGLSSAGGSGLLEGIEPAERAVASAIAEELWEVLAYGDSRAA